MTTKQRLDLIERYIREHKYADLHTLASSCDTSLSTIRRALDTLETRGVLRRHHGGATLIETDERAREYDFIARDQRQAAEKHAVARRIADLVQPGMTIILDGGTSVYAVARLLATKRLQVITSSLPIAALYADLGSLETIVTGGSIDNRLGVLVGPLCEQSLGQIHADLAILGAAGVTEAGVWNHNALLVASQRRMIAASERTLFAIDGSKFGRKALALACPFDPRFTFVTDRAPAPAIAASIRAAKANIEIAPASE
ncbi:MAG: DeoR/GlpR family DNA-binding transcription regulator [Verrucomicrobia bacterium]|nr:DeoR/GlpR family DNA-binding transcription regulator [Verrucomicrobiota bacterium]